MVHDQLLYGARSSLQHVKPRLKMCPYFCVPTVQVEERASSFDRLFHVREFVLEMVLARVHAFPAL